MSAESSPLDNTSRYACEIASQKITASWEASVTPQGFGDPYQAAHILYSSLYRPDKVMSAVTRQLTPLKETWLTEPFDGFSRQPELDAFTQAIWETTIATSPDPEHVFYGVSQGFAELRYRQPELQIVPWTTGNTSHQLAKLARLNMHLTNATKPATFPAIEPLAGWEPLHTVGIVSPDKLDDTAVAELALLTEGTNRIAIDDRPQNLLELQRKLPGTIGVWAIQGWRAHSIKEQLDLHPEALAELATAIRQGAITPIERAAMLPNVIDTMQALGYLDCAPRTSLILDIDDTLLDTQHRLRGQHSYVLQALARHSWIR